MRCDPQGHCPNGACREGFCVVSDDGGVADSGSGGGGGGVGGAGGGEPDAGPLLVITALEPPTRLAGNLSPEDPFLGATAWKRDEKATLFVRTTPPLSGVPALLVLGIGGDAGYSSAGVVLMTGCPGCGTNCFCFTVELSAPRFEAFDGQLLAMASVSTATGPMTAALDGGMRVTRWRWMLPLSNPDDFTHPPAIDSNGNILVGVARDAGTGIISTIGTVWSVNPNGRVNWLRATSGAVSAPIAIGETQRIYVPTRTPAGGFIATYQLDGGVITGPGGCPQMAGHTIVAAVAVSSVAFPASNHEQVTMLLEDRVSLEAQMAGHRITDVDAGCNLEVPPRSNLVTTEEAAIAVKGRAAAYATLLPDRQVSMRNLKLDQFPNWPTFNSQVTGTTPRSLALVSGNQLYGSGSTAAPAGGVFRFATDMATKDWQWPPTLVGIGSVGHVAVGDGPVPVLFFGASVPPKLYRVPSESDPDGGESVTVPGFIPGSPVLGEGDAIYAATEAGRFVAFDSRAGLRALWTSPLPDAGADSFDTSPNLDCARDATGGLVARRPGSLYVIGRTSGALYSIIVDSPGMARTAPWPRYQHDGRNSGNADTIPGEYSCP